MIFIGASLIKETYNKWTEHTGPRLGAALAYYAIFSIPPLMLIALAVLGIVYSGDIMGRLQSQLASLVGDETARTLLTGVQMKGQAGGVIAGLIGILVLLFGASGVFTELQDALNTIWEVKPKEEGIKGLVKGRFTSFTMVLGICFLLLVSLVVSSVVAAMSQAIAAWMPGGEALGHLLELSVSLIVITMLFAMIFKVLPDVRVHWNDVWVGAAVTALLFTMGKFAIGTYIGKAGIGSGYGAAGSIVILITWIYYSAQILYFGAEFTKVYAERHGSRFVAQPNAEPLTAEDRARQRVTVNAKETAAPAVLPVIPVMVPLKAGTVPAPQAPSQPKWHYAVVAITWIGTALLIGKTAGRDDPPNRSAA
jgi:membrane protein